MPQVLDDDKYSIKRGPFGSAIKKAFFVPQGYKVYEQKNAIYDNFDLGEYYIDEDKYNELKAFEVKSGDLIISCSGTVGRVAVAPDWMEKGVINQALLKITLNQKMLTNDYFKILFSAYYMKTETLLDLKGTAQKNMVSVNTLKNEPFPYPPYAELFRIVAKVDELMALCDQLEQQTETSLLAHQTLVETLLNTLLNADQNSFDQAWERIAQHFDVLFTTEHSIDQLKQTILQLAVMGKLVPQDPNDEPASVLLEKIAAEKEQLIKDGKLKKQKPVPPVSDDEKLFEVPNGWEWVTLSEINALVTDGDHQAPPKADEGIPFLVIGNLNKGSVDFTNSKYVPESYYENLDWTRKPCSDDLLYTVTGSYGIPVKIESNKPFCVQRHVAILKTIKSTPKEYLIYALSSKMAFDFSTEVATGIAQKTVPLTGLRRMPLALPPKEECLRIVTKIKELMGICDMLKVRLYEFQATQLCLADAMAEQALN